MLFYGTRSKNLSRPQSPRPTSKVDGPTSRDQRKQNSTAATATAHVYKQSTGTYQNFAQNVLMTLPQKEDSTVELKDVLSAVWQCQEITDVCPDLVIRLTSLRGEISKLVWRELGNDPDDIQVLAVGTTAIPQHLPRYHRFLRQWLDRTTDLHREAKEEMDFAIGYDLLSKGSSKAAAATIELFNMHYGFLGESQMDDFKSNFAITCGGMRGLKDIVDSLVHNATVKGEMHRFIQPDNSFGTWWNIIERGMNKLDRDIRTIQARPENRLHLSPEDVVDFYEKIGGACAHESWYITPVGNPSGTKMTHEQLSKVCATIYKYNPKAVIILDTVYVRTLRPSDARKLLSGVLSKPHVLSRVIFVESFSKSHGLCRERLGCYFSANSDLFKSLHVSNISYSAGPGEYKDYQFQALGEASEEDNLGVSDLHLFWQKERLGLFKYLMVNFAYLFDPMQAHISPEDLEVPLGLYVLLKTRDGIKAQDIFMTTGVLGVDTPLLSGHYVRFSVGQLTRPVYSIEKS